MDKLASSEESKPILHYDPFRFYEELHKLFNGFISQEPWQLPMGWWSGGFAQPKLAIDITESDADYRITADLPGVKKENIKVNVDGKAVTVTADITEEKKIKEGDRVLHSERHHSDFYRRFYLDKDIDESKVKATYTDGVLNLTLPKKEAGQGKKVIVE